MALTSDSGPCHHRFAEHRTNPCLLGYSDLMTSTEQLVNREYYSLTKPNLYRRLKYRANSHHFPGSCCNTEYLSQIYLKTQTSKLILSITAFSIAQNIMKFLLRAGDCPAVWKTWSFDNLENLSFDMRGKTNGQMKFEFEMISDRFP